MRPSSWLRIRLLAGELDEFTLDRPASIDRFGGEQLAGNAEVVRRVPLDARAVGRQQPWHDAEHRVALIKQQLFDLSGLCADHLGQPWHNLMQDRGVGVGLERADHTIEDALNQIAQHLLAPMRWADLDSDGEWRFGCTYRLGHLELGACACAGER
jgi:hypothetical protein